MTADKIELVGNSLIQHGKENDRVYLMKLSEKDSANIIKDMENLVCKNGYSKIFAKIPANLRDYFITNGFIDEAHIKNFFKNEQDCCFLSKYFTPERKELANEDRVRLFEIIKLCQEKAPGTKPPKLGEGLNIKPLGEKDILQITQVYKEVFQSYPFPIFDPDYILETMKDNVEYYGILKGDTIIALSSSEMDLENSNTEMTDFATLPKYRGHNFSYHLLEKMEKSAKDRGIKTAYTIARSENVGINTIFAKRFYKFGGILINNTNICGNIQSMNVWYKDLQKVSVQF